MCLFLVDNVLRSLAIDESCSVVSGDMTLERTGSEISPDNISYDDFMACLVVCY
jgi:hypothetical protein